MPSKELWYDGEETKEITTAGSKTHDRSIFGPVHLSDATRALLNINSILRFFEPCGSVEEFDDTLTCYCNFANIVVDAEVLNWAHERLDVRVLALGSRSD